METKELEEWIKTKCKVEIAECPHVDKHFNCPYRGFKHTAACYDVIMKRTFDESVYNHITHICNMKSVLASEAETQAVLADKELMAQIEESRKDYKEGKCRNAEELFKELGV